MFAVLRPCAALLLALLLSACDSTIRIGTDRPLLANNLPPGNATPLDAGPSTPDITASDPSATTGTDTTPSETSGTDTSAETTTEDTTAGETTSTTLPPAPSAVDAGPTPPDAGTPSPNAPLVKGTLLWSSGFESGDASDWENNGGYFYLDNGMAEYPTDHVHAGNFALRATLNQSVGQMQLFYRGNHQHAVYGAWYGVFAALQVDYWAVMKLRGHLLPGDAIINDIFDIVASTTAEGNFRIGVFDKRANSMNQTALTFAVGEWVHLEADYLQVVETGHLKLYVNGALAFDSGPGLTGATDAIEWGVGSTSPSLLPAPGAIWIDDATIHEPAPL